MSQEKVALFVKAIAEKKELNQKVAGAAKDTGTWVQLGKDAGYDFTSDDFIAFVKAMSGTKSSVDAKNAVTVLLGSGMEMSDRQLEQVSGGVTSYLAFSPTLLTSIGSRFNFNIAASFVKTSGPEFVKSGSMPSGGFTY